MGWTFPYLNTRKEVVESRLKSWEIERNGMLVTTKCLAHCFRGGRLNGVLWSVWERTFTNDEIDVQEHERFITCDLIRREGGEWGYKDMTESCGPFYFSCPLKYLELVPPEKYSGTNSEWRDEVRKHHANQAENEGENVSKRTSRDTRSEIVRPRLIPFRWRPKMSDSTETLRRVECQQINADPGSREYLEAEYGQVWTTKEMQRDFEVLGFSAPYCIVKRRSDGVRGSIKFQHDPRFYFSFEAE